MNKLQYTLFMLKRCYVLWLLILLNITMYVAMCADAPSFSQAFFVGPDVNTLLLFGAKENGLIGLWQLERLFLPIFMHANLVHLTVNMVCLWSLGRIFEVIVGHRRLFLIYLISGVMGNLCSLTFIPQISVGASGSLFGILFCFYIIQKYEDMITKKFKKDGPSESLGNIILFNAFLNFIFALTYPIFDWASHLGGSLAGVLLGCALVTKHNWHLKIILYKTGFHKQEPKRTLRDEYRLFYVGLVVIAGLFFSSIFSVTKDEKIEGMARLLSAENTTKPQMQDDLFQFRSFLIEKNRESNPQELFKGALYVHQKAHFFAATKMYDVLMTLFDAHLGNGDFFRPETKEALEQLIHMAGRDEIPSPVFLKNLLQNGGEESAPLKSTQDVLSTSAVEEICAKPAQLFMALGFFQISGNLYTCAFALNPTKVSYAVRGLSSFMIENDVLGQSQIHSLIQVYQDVLAL